MNNWKITSIADLQSAKHYSSEYIGDFVVGDNCAHEWSVIVKEGNEPVSLDGYSATAYILRPDGNTVAVGGTINENKITAVFPAECYAVDGWCSAVMKIEKSDASTASIGTIKFLVSSLTSEIYVDPGEALDIKTALEAAKAAVSYNPQSPSETQKSTARTNIDAANVALEKLLSIEPQTFEHTGNPVQFESFKGMPLKIIMKFDLIQSGKGDPFPGGSGRNLFNIGTAVSANTSGSTVEVNGNTVRVYSTTAGMYHGMKSDAISLTAGTTYTLSGTATDITSGNVRLCVRKVSGNTVLSNSTILFSETGSGSATFTPAEDVDAYVSVLVTWTTAENGDATFENIQLEIGDAATAYVPWENIRPISGRESVTVRACGKNLLDGAQITPTNSENTAVTHDGHSIRIQGENAAYCDGRIIIYLPAGTYTIQADITVRSGVARITRRASTDGGKTYPSAVTDLSPVGANGYTFTVKPGAEWNMISFYATWNEIESGDVTYADIRLYAGETAAGFESYCGSTFTQPLDQTVYGGTLDWNTGALTVDRGIRIYDGTNYSWSKSSATIFDRYLNGISDALAPSRVVCSHAPSNKKDTDLNWIYINDYGTLSWNFATYGTTTVGDFNTYLAAQYAAGTPVQVCYKLASPTIIHLTPQQITALAGVNTVYCDGDELIVSGRTDIMGVIERILERVAALESADVSDANISS